MRPNIDYFRLDGGKQYFDPSRGIPRVMNNSAASPDGQRASHVGG
jgi:hypothetical protein